MKTYGRMIGIDRKDLVNDDMSVMSSVPGTLGRQSAVTLERRSTP